MKRLDVFSVIQATFSLLSAGVRCVEKMAVIATALFPSSQIYIINPFNYDMRWN